jgi:hypothetical protein
VSTPHVPRSVSVFAHKKKKVLWWLVYKDFYRELQ